MLLMFCGDKLEVEAKHKTSIEEALDRIHKNENMIIELYPSAILNPLKSLRNLLRKPDQLTETYLANLLLPDFITISKDTEASFSYVKYNLTELRTQLELDRFGKFYGPWYCKEIGGLKPTKTSAIDPFLNGDWNNIPTQAIFINVDLPKDENNISKSKEIVEHIVASLREKLNQQH